MSRVVGMQVTVTVTVDLDDWELAYGTDSRDDVREHVTETIKESVKETFRVQANGSEVATVSRHDLP